MASFNSFIHSIAADVYDLQREKIISYDFLLDYCKKIFSDWTDNEKSSRPVDIEEILYCAEMDYCL